MRASKSSLLQAPRRRSALRLLVAAALAAAGCATQANSDYPGSPAATGVSARLELTPPAHGFQVETLGTMIDPGDDIRWCESVRLPGGPEDVYYVNRIETKATAHAQDLIVSVAPPGSETEAIMDVGSRVPCTRAGEAFGEDMAEVTSTQRTYHDERYAAGVGQVFYGGQKVAVDYHYVNGSDEPLPAKVKLNFHTVDEALVQHQARVAGFNNLTIYTPPGGRSSHLAECAVSQDVLVGELVRRTQQRGTAFTVWFAGGDRDGQLLWRSRSPSDARLALTDPIHLSPGEGFRFQCDYVNPTDLELRFGVNASDEMCTLNATYWLANEQEPSEAQGCLLLEVGPDGVARK
jgi:hypothetical protein